MAKAKKAPATAVEKMEMSLADAKAFRASLYKPQPKALSENQKREAFRIYWASQKSQYSKAKSLEHSLWLHLSAIQMNTPDKFADGLAHFGLKKVK